MRCPLLLLAFVTLAACHPDIYAEVESSTSWSGSFGGATVDGSGNKRINLPDDPPQCAVVQKNTESGSLRLRISSEGGFLIPEISSGDWITTTAAYGVVSACGE